MRSIRYQSFLLFFAVLALLMAAIVVNRQFTPQGANAATLDEFVYLPVVQSGARPLVGQIVVDPTRPTWLFFNKDDDGDGRLDPLFIAGPGDPEGFLYCGSAIETDPCANDQTAVINKLAGTGANSIYLQAIRSHGGDGDSTHNPFIDHDPNKGLDEAVLDQWETWFTAMDNAGIIIYFFFYDDDACIWDCTSNTVPPEEKAFIQTLVNRFNHHKHLIWVIAEEYSEEFSSQRAANIAAEIRQADERAHPIALHQLDGLTFDLPDDPNIDQFAIQYNSSGQTMHNGVVSAWNDANGRYNLNMSESALHGTGVTGRKNSWGAAMAGAYVMVYTMNIADTPISDLEDLGRLRAFFETTNFYDMAPRDDLAYGGTDYALAQEGSSYIAYAADLSGDIGLKNMTAGAYHFTWYDIAADVTIHQNNKSINAGNQTWTKPSGMGSEIAVYIRRAN